MPHTSFAARKRSKNPSVRTSLFDQSPVQKAVSQFGQGTNIQDIFRAIQTQGVQPQLPPEPFPGGLGGQPVSISPSPVTLTPPVIDDSPTAQAARLLSGAVAGNPFISQEGQGRLQGGQAPLLNQITPSFFRQTSPVIQQSLLGLFQSLGLRPEDVSFIMQQFTPRGFSR
ncbi:hypothetical protein LCGC14_0410330 [marine sediment metagenome]|uniref:Uncharacterized protein n=1 Tax=marine sediment metagenome TaxID=412755 RepID=A0A0F9SZU7_9ZZZZ